MRDAWREILVYNDSIGIARAVSDVINRQGISEQLDMDVALTLIFLGDQDVATVLHESERINARIQHSNIPNF